MTKPCDFFYCEGVCINTRRCVSLSSISRLTSFAREIPNACYDVSVRRNAALRSRRFVTSIFMTLRLVMYLRVSERFGRHFGVFVPVPIFDAPGMR